MIFHKKLKCFGLILPFAMCLTSCAAGVKGTPGMKLYSDGQIDEAIPLLKAEVAAGEVSARYSLGLAYRDGQGVEQDKRTSEILLTGAAIGGDPRAVAAIRESLRTTPRCEKDTQLHNLWGSVSVMYRNLITGVVELHNAPSGTLRSMAAIYNEPCEGAPVQEEAAKSLLSLSGGPRHMWIYVPR